MPKIPQVLLGLVALGVAGAGAAYWRSRPPQVPVAFPQVRTVTESIAASGRLRGERETSVGARLSGRVARMLVREGALVRKGQVLAWLDDEILQTQLAQAEDAVHTAQATLAQAEESVQTVQSQLAVAARPPLPSDLRRLKADTNQAVLVGEARLVGARQKLIVAQQRLMELKRGPREEELEASEAQMRQGEASLAQAERDKNRQTQLAREGAVSQAAADQAETNYWVAKRTLESAQARLKQLRVGTRPEQLEQAEAEVRVAQSEVRAAEATVTGARSSGSAQLSSLLANPRSEDVVVARNRLSEAEGARAVAQARLREARRALEVARQRLLDVQVTAPFEGTITQIVTEAGALTGPSAPLVRLVRTSVPEIRLDLDEVNLGKLKVGQEAIVSSDAFPEENLRAYVSEVGAQVDTERGTVEVRLKPMGSVRRLRPGQTLSVNILLGEAVERLIVPLTAITTIGGVSTLFVVQGETAVKRTVKAGPAGPEGIPVLEGITSETAVVLNPMGRKSGERIAPVIRSSKTGSGT